MKLIFAQGNPGKQYERTRHNVGFYTVDAFALEHAAKFKLESKYKAEIATVTVNNEKVLLVKPHSYYNETGLVARALVDFYKLNPATDVLVIHDELALPFGTVRVREKGSDAGNNGVKSLNAHLGPTFWRLRIGIWNDLRDQINDVDFVIGKFTSKEQTELQKITAETVLPLIDEFIAGSLEGKTV